MPNKKALVIFLGLTFGLTIGLAITARVLGLVLFDAPVFMSQMVIAGAMFVPGISALIVQKWVLHKSLKELGFRWGPRSMYFKTYLLIFLIFAVNYAITWAFFAKPDFTLGAFLDQYNITTGLPLPAGTMIWLFGLLTLIGAPIFNMIPSLGEELGWRGFLLPALEPWGARRAMIISGMIWALWHTPMILLMGFGYGRQASIGWILHFVLVTGLGIWMGYVWLKTRSTILAAFMHAVFNAHAYGLWSMLFISDNRLLIGPAGLIGATLCLALGIATLYKTRIN